MDGAGRIARFYDPTGVAADGVGNVFVADSTNHTIRKISITGEVTTFAGTAGSIGSMDATGSAAQFNNPTGVAVDGAGNVYVADSGNNSIRKITVAGAVTTLAAVPEPMVPLTASGVRRASSLLVVSLWMVQAMSTWLTFPII